MSKKQDRGRARTAHDLEMKYNLGGQKELLKEMQKAISEAKKDISNMQNGDVSENAISKTVSVFLEPGVEEEKTIVKHVTNPKTIPDDKLKLYDFTGDGAVKSSDALVVEQVVLGKKSLANWEKAVKSNVTVTIDMSTPENLIRAIGTNMWGRDVEYNTGDFIEWLLQDIEANKIKIENLKEEIKNLSSSGSGSVPYNDFIVEQGKSNGWYYEKWDSGKAVCRQLYQPNTQTFYSTDTEFKYHSYTVSLPSIFEETPYYISANPYYTGEYHGYTTIKSAFKQAFEFEAYLHTADNATSFDCNFFIEVIGNYMVG